MLKILRHIFISSLTSFSFRLAAAFLLVILLMATALGGGIIALETLLNQSQHLTQLQKTQNQLFEIKVTLLEDTFQVSQQTLLNRYQSLYDYTHPRTGQSPLANKLSAYANFVQSPNATNGEQPGIVNTLNQYYQNLQQVVNRISDQLKVGNLSEAIAIVQDEFNTQVNQFNSYLDTQIQKLAPQVEAQKGQLEETSATSQSLLIIGGLSVGLIASILALMLAIVLGKGIRSLGRAVQALGEGNLSARVKKPGRDELGRVGLAFNSMADRLNLLINEIEGKRQVGQLAGTEVASIINHLSSMAQEQATVAYQQFSTVNQLTTSLEELVATVRHIAERANEVAVNSNTVFLSASYVKKMAQETSQASQESRQHTAQSISITNQLEFQITSARSVLQELVAQSNLIEDMVKLINNIAAETHLLAINGAIEAASAGNYGARFAVIAAAVRDLANRTHKAANQATTHVAIVRTSIQRLEQAIEETVSSSDQGVKLAHRAGQAVERLGDFAIETDNRFSQIVEAIASVVTLSEQIKITTLQHNTASSQLNEAMHFLNATSRTVATSSEELAKTTSQLRGVSEVMLEKMAN